MKTSNVLLLVVFVLFPFFLKAQTIVSPDGNLRLSLFEENSLMVIRVSI